MIIPKFKSAIDTAAAKLRETVLSSEDGALLGSEENLQTALGVSRATVRQAARLLEREGLLRVKRGINGGYFGARPDIDTIEKAVSTYLELLNVEAADLTRMASVLWVEVIHKAAGLKSPAVRELAEQFREKVQAVPSDAGFHLVAELEQDFRTALFNLIGSRYIELIFQINLAFAHRRFPTSASERNGTPEHVAFLRDWRNAKLMELAAIADGDQELGAIAARHLRNVWQRRVSGDNG